MFLATAGSDPGGGGGGDIPEGGAGPAPAALRGTISFKGLAVSLGAAISNPRVIILGIINAAGLRSAWRPWPGRPASCRTLRHLPGQTSMYVIAALGAAQVISNPLGVVAAAK